MNNSEDVICSHAKVCHNIEGIDSKVEDCMGRRPHRLMHEEDQPFHCLHADGAWVKPIALFIRNPELTGGIGGIFGEPVLESGGTLDARK